VVKSARKYFLEQALTSSIGFGNNEEKERPVLKK
jgi:hypothetical protein